MTALSFSGGKGVRDKAVILECSAIVILRCHSEGRLMGEKSEFITFDQIKLLLTQK